MQVQHNKNDNCPICGHKLTKGKMIYFCNEDTNKYVFSHYACRHYQLRQRSMKNRIVELENELSKMQEDLLNYEWQFYDEIN
jgi:ribosomal protein L24E